MFQWIDDNFRDINDKILAICRRALKNLIVHNKERGDLLEHAIEMCYITEKPRALESYFEVVTQVLIEQTDYPLEFWKILGLVLVTLGSQQRVIRMESARLLRTLEERQQMSSKLQDFDISISDKTTAVYKLAQFETSKRLSTQHSDLAFLIFSEFTRHFRQVGNDYKRNMVAAILPWIQIIELQVDPNGGPTAKSFMLLSNLLEITISSSSILHNEVQALWRALATGPHAGNVQLVLDFIITVCLERREQNFVEFAKQIVVFLSSTPAGSKVIEFLLLQLTPRNMVHDNNREPAVHPDIQGFPYVADLTKILPIGNKQNGFALGQVSFIFLVDLMIAPIKLAAESLPKLLHIVLILWDHYTPSVREHAREMLVHLLHELVISPEGHKLPDRQQKIEDFVDSVRQKDATLEWQYEDSNENDPDDDSIRVPPAMSHLVNEVVDLFGIADDSLNDDWSKLALNWATSCPVQHLACRSFQIFRCISTSLDAMMLADMLARLSNTIADETISFQTFSMEILTTLRTIISSLEAPDLTRYPQLFWITCACLETTHEREFMECLRMLDTFLDKVDISDPVVVRQLLDGQPSKWQGNFEGLQPLLYKGLKSSEAMAKTLSMLQKLTALPNNELLGDSDRLLFAVLANLPHFLSQFDSIAKDQNCSSSAMLLADVAEEQHCGSISWSLRAFGTGQTQSRKDFLYQTISAIKAHFFPKEDVSSLIFLMGLLTNTSTWFRLRTMEILCVVIPEIDMRQPRASCYGPDLISPLLRLLQTDLCTQALDVLDHIMTVSGNPLENKHIRMSMPSSSAREIRREYDRTQSLYGIPESTGWSIPMPAVHSKTTRDNVHAVFYTCADDPERMEAQAAATPEVEFQAEDYGNSYFPSRRTATMKSVDTQNDGNMGDLVQKLDSLDDFFEETIVHHDANGSLSGSTLRGYSTDLHENIYDQQTAPILRKTLNRTASSSSFHGGFMDPQSRPSTSREPLAMTPTAFAVPASALPSVPPARPSMHSRAATTPATNYSDLTMTRVADEDDLDLNPDPGAFSDGEDRLIVMTSSNPATENTTPSDGSSPWETVVRGTRLGIRRLTGGGSTKEKEKQRDFLRAQQRVAMQTAASPRVPKVPAEYLQGSPTSPAN
jgi:Cell morphogenesis C-terminal/Cell morphogenesis central region